MADAANPSGELPPAAKAAADKAVQKAIQEVSSKSTDGNASGDAAPTTSAEDADDSNRLEEGEIDEKELSEKLQRTVFDNANDFNIIHPLRSKWCLWFDNASKADKAKSWEEQLTQVMSFDSVEEFWGLYNNIVPPSLIANNSNYYLFKQGIRPAWEDVANAKGGKWAVQLPKDKSIEKIDRWWLYTMLAAIGETFEIPYTTAPLSPKSLNEAPIQDQVTGVIVSSRKAFFRLNIWTRDSDEKSKVEDIGKHFKYGVMGYGDNFGKGKSGQAMDGKSLQSDVEFTSHEAAQSRHKSKGWTV